MPDCDYCGESFDGEDAYLNHLADEHANELGPIDRRKVEGQGAGTDDIVSSIPTGPLALVFVIGVSIALIVYVTFFFGGGSASGPGSGEPYNVGSVHYHGTINMTVTGERVDFSRSEYQLQADAFHFESNEGRRWHAHAQGVTLQWAMQSLDINVTENSVTFEGTTYRDSDPDVSVEVTVNDQSVVPSEYVLQEGDHIRIVVTQS